MKKLLLVLFVMATCTTHAATETVNWYSDGTVYDTTTCQTGDDIIVPITNPTKRGHTFNGWVFVYDFSTLDPSIAGDSYVNSGSNMTWAVTYSYGTVSGRALCAKNSGGIPDELVSGSTCWCKAITYTPSGSTVEYENLSPSVWVRRGGYASASACGNICASHCGMEMKGDRSFRSTAFGITQ